MNFKSYFYAATAFICFGSLSVPAHAGQLFPPANIGSNPNTSCPNGSLLTWRGDHVDCANPTPGVTVSCPSGQVLNGISNGVPMCTAGNILYSETITWSYLRGDEPASYNSVMGQAINSWPPLIGSPDAAGWVTACSVNPVTGAWDTSDAQRVNTCGFMICHQQTGHFAVMAQLGGSCALGEINCGGVGNNGFAINWHCIYTQ